MSVLHPLPMEKQSKGHSVMSRHFQIISEQMECSIFSATSFLFRCINLPMLFKPHSSILFKTINGVATFVITISSIIFILQNVFQTVHDILYR